MTTSTQCPQCGTRFKVSQEQLDAHQGMVRCGRCQAVFNAVLYLHDDQPSPQLDLPIALEVNRQTPAAVSQAEPASTGMQNKIASAAPSELAQKFIFTDGMDIAPAEPVRKKIFWPWAIGSLLLLIVLLAQAAYFFRVELGANLPGLKPALISYCDLLRCTVPLPQKADLMSIESSELEADPAQAGVIALNALLRNQAPYAQAYPNLELSLTDAQEKVLARRTFLPPDYLKPDTDEQQGLAANRELAVTLNLDTTDLKASGYRLFLFYPQ
jgi:predicted Zn finger-like uncharacterized protein